ncbi:protein kinase domain-containing protein [Chondromyces crocatus]|uniref:Protein kinase n=1 Tax=Chondromyces crocatus TaxID=52 RepID=A0A0K1E988_CHOCO|nr:protein kinase [Chondromyces crocatus]AKT37419.1 protein kinase [Chondromyces crocatus]
MQADTIRSSPDSASLSSTKETQWTSALLSEVDPARYVVSGQIAQGGLGRVMRAEDVRMGRMVALKELIDREQEAEDRFVREALLTSRLQHPSIVPVYEAGRWPTGAPFYAMKLVSGRSLAEVIKEPRGLDERLPLVTHVLAVAQAMAYAHAERIIHRDLKPANVLVGDFGETVVIDWGLAKELSAAPGEASASASPSDAAPPEEQATAALTVVGTVVGTPAYMPPEQAAGGAVDERADVYAIGAMLYHLLAGAPPYEGTARKVVSEVLQRPPPPLAGRTPGVPEDLLAIVGKAMARRPEARYPSARELADDLGRFHAGQLVGAHRYSMRELALRFARRHRGTLSVAAAALFVLLAGGTYGLVRVMHARDHAAEEQARAEQALVLVEEARKAAVDRADQLLLVQARTALDRDPNESLTWLQSLSPGFTEWSAVRTLAADARGRGVARVLRGHRMYINSMVFAPDGRTLYTASDDRTVRLWDLERGQHRVLTTHSDEAWGVRVSSSGRYVVTTSLDRQIRVHDLEQGTVKALLGHTEAVVDAVFTPDEGALLSYGDDGTVRWWDAKTGEGRTLCDDAELCVKAYFTRDRRYGVSAGLGGKTGPEVVSRRGPGAVAWLDVGAGTVRRAPAAVSVHADIVRLLGILPIDIQHDGQRIAAGGGDGIVRLWEPATGRVQELVGHDAPVARMLFASDGRRLASADVDGTVRLWDLATGTSRVARGHEGLVTRLMFSPDGRWLASAGSDWTTRLWDLETDQRRTLSGARDTVFALDFSPDSRALAAASFDGVVRLFRVDAGLSQVFGRHAAPALALEIDAQSRRVATGDARGEVHVRALDTGEQRVFQGSAEHRVLRVAFTADGTYLVSSGDDGMVRVWDREGRARHQHRPGGSAHPLFALSPDGTRLAVAGAAVHIVRLADGTSRALQSVTSDVEWIAFSPDGRRLGTTHADGSVRLWDPDGEEVRVLGGHDRWGTGLVFSPAGGLLATGGFDHLLRLWDLGGAPPRSIETGGAWAAHLEFTRDGRLLFGLNGLANAQVWDVERGALTQELRGHAGRVLSLHPAPDGRTAISTGEDGTVRVWDLVTSQSMVLRGHAGKVYDARVLPEGRGFVSVGEDGTVRLWPDDLPRDPEGLRAWITGAVQAAGP